MSVLTVKMQQFTDTVFFKNKIWYRVSWLDVTVNYFVIDVSMLIKDLLFFMLLVI